MLHQRDPLHGQICHFYDIESARCSIYAVRPHSCAAFPSGNRCHLFDFLESERERQKNPALIIGFRFSIDANGIHGEYAKTRRQLDEEEDTDYDRDAEDD